MEKKQDFGKLLLTFWFWYIASLTSQKMKFSVKNFSSKCDQIRSFWRIWSHLLEISLMENFIFCVVPHNLPVKQLGTYFQGIYEVQNYFLADAVASSPLNIQ